jgi:hypothetical protein
MLTYHNDIGSTGLNPTENQLTTANVQVGSFGKVFTTPVDGQVYAQPLVQTGLTINGGVHDVVFVATEHDSLYAIDAASGGVLWQRSFLDPSNPSNNTLGATAIATVSSNDVGTTDISPEIGITGTPVIDPSTSTLYVVAKTKETIGGSNHFVQRLHAINLSDGTDQVAPYLIGDSTGPSTPIYVYGSGAGSVTDPYNGTGKPVVPFDAFAQNQRGALNLVNNTVYVEWASHGDFNAYHGWVAAWDVSGLTTKGLTLKGVLNITPNGSAGGIWQGGGRLAFEPDGSAFYFETGNGDFNQSPSNFGANGLPLDGDYGDSVVKVVADPTTTPTNQNVNGWGLKVVDFFTPYNQAALNSADQDFGSGAPMVLPAAAGLPGHPNLLVAAGKEGKVYLLDRNSLGQFDPNNDHALNAVPDGAGQNTPPKLLDGVASTAGYFNGRIYYTAAYNGPSEALAINPDGTLSITSQTSATLGVFAGSPSISASGTTGGIVWQLDRNRNVLAAYDAGTFATELWDSGQKAGGADSLGAAVKFTSPTVANGQVFVGTTNSLVVYGLTPPQTSAPNAPSGLVATALSATSVNLTWQDGSIPPNTASGYYVEQSTDNVTFTQVTTAPAGSTSIAVGGLAPTTTYYFRIRGFNGVGNSPYSNVASVTTPAAPSGTPGLVAAYNFDEGAGTVLHDLSGNGNDGTVSNAAWVSSGKFGGALSFNGTNAWVTVADAPSLDLAGGMTLEAWVSPTQLTSPGGWSAALGKEHQNSSNDVAYALYAATGPGAPPGVHALVGGSDYGAGDSAAVPLGAWTFLAGTYDGATLTLYVNGSPVGSTAVPGSILATADPLRIGGDWSAEMFTGLIDNVRLYNRALSATDIQADMNTAVGGHAMLLEASPPTPSGGDPLTPQELAPVVQEGIALWGAAGVSADRLQVLKDTHFWVGALPSPYLGLTSDGQVWISQDAGGYGWWTDPSPGTAVAPGRMDLLTVVLHEMGHVLGNEEEGGQGVMSEDLAPGRRLLPQASDVAGIGGGALAPVASLTPLPLVPSVGRQLPGLASAPPTAQATPGGPGTGQATEGPQGEQPSLASGPLPLWPSGAGLPAMGDGEATARPVEVSWQTGPAGPGDTLGGLGGGTGLFGPRLGEDAGQDISDTPQGASGTVSFEDRGDPSLPARWPSRPLEGNNAGPGGEPPTDEPELPEQGTSLLDPLLGDE